MNCFTESGSVSVAIDFPPRPEPDPVEQTLFRPERRAQREIDDRSQKPTPLRRRRGGGSSLFFRSAQWGEMGWGRRRGRATGLCLCVVETTGRIRVPRLQLKDFLEISHGFIVLFRK